MEISRISRIFTEVMTKWPNDVLVQPTEKVSRTVRPSGKNESRALNSAHTFYMYVFTVNVHKKHTYPHILYVVCVHLLICM